MMKRIWFCVFCSVLMLDVFSQNSTDNTLQIDSILNSSCVDLNGSAIKAQGDSAYMREDYITAIQIYENLLAQGESADIYYNLGNCYYKVDNIAKAILNYERAILLQPGNADIRANLEIARSKTIDKVVSVPDVFFIVWGQSLIHSLSVDTWAKVGIIFFIFLLISSCLFFFSKQILWRKVGFIVGLFSLLLVILSNIAGFLQKNELINRNKAIVLSPSVTVRSTPSESGTSLFILHEGHKIEVKDNSMREWKEIRLEDGKIGWIPSDAIEII